MLRRRSLHRLVLGSTFALAALVTSPASAEDVWSSPYPGMSLLHRTTPDPNHVYVLFTDLCAPGVSIRATTSDERQQRTSTWAGARDVEAAFNGDLFSYGSYATFGVAMGNGGIWPDTSDDDEKGFVAFGRNLTYYSRPWGVIEGIPAGATEAVSGLRPMIFDGVMRNLDDCDSIECELHPRTAMGLTRDKRTLILLAVDGRQGDSIGFTDKQTALTMQEFGAWNAFNLDGGGSTTAWIKGQGIINDPSDDAGERVVANHIGIHADGIELGAPMACNEDPIEELLNDAHELDGLGSTDIDADGKSDVCIRSSADLSCHASGDGGFGDPIVVAELSDAAGWAEPDNYTTLRMGDITGDGRADACIRANAGIICFVATDGGFGPEVAGPPLSDEAGWADPGHYTTLRMADVTGDGLDDLCGRGPEGFSCWPSKGDGSFGDEIPLLREDGEREMADAWGWNAPQHYGTLRMGDLDFDGKADVCARAVDGVYCWRSLGDGFSPAITGPSWRDDQGWGNARYWSTIRMADIDGDGAVELCARSSASFFCQRFDGVGFGPELAGPPLSDANGWDDQANYLTLRMGDVDGDGKADVCGRSNTSFMCWASTGEGFSEEIPGPELSDLHGWYGHRYFRTIRLVDVDGDGKSDVCARGGAGLDCWLSDGAGFPTYVAGPAWADAQGWGSPQYYMTFRASGPPPRHPSDGGGGGGGGEGGSNGAGGGPSGSGGNGSDAGETDGGSGDGCGCRTTDEDRGARGLVALGAVAAALVAARSRRRTGTHPRR
ncbi:MAG: hypothetical protein HOW73_10815 [Polyangiaceae bacterium]|nr:hypothetical protein [Polyangiaceae bacterium]